MNRFSNPATRKGATGPSIRRAFATSLVLAIAFFPAFGVSPASADTARETLEQLSLLLQDRLEARRTQLYFDLSQEDAHGMRGIRETPGVDLMYIDGRGHPVYYATKNRVATETVTTHLLWPGGYSGFNLDGGSHAQGEVGIWDFGAVRTSHQELTGRVSWADTASYVPVDHATLVAGTMAASGVVPQAIGMAPGGLLDSYDWNNDLAEMATAAANGMLVSNHSYGGALGWALLPGDTLWRWFGDGSVSASEDYYFGYYDSLTMDLDRIAYDAPYYTIVRAAGNDRGEGPGGDTLHWHWDANTASWAQSSDHHDVDGGASGWDCTDFFATGKNVLTVGSCSDMPWGVPQVPVISAFSAHGPTDDGRVKPDFVANGEALFSPVAFSDSLYTFATGTSMASPGVAGSVSLVIEYFENALGYTPLASTVKALLIESAHDEGNLGPDYTWGWGRLNTLSAVYWIQGDSLAGGDRIREDTLANGETREWYVQVPDGYTLTVTMAWTDPPGSPPQAGLDPSTPMLVNDLDMRLVSLDADSTVLPFVLDPANPASPAVPGDNVLDNAEKVFVPGWANIGDYYKLTISHKGTLASPQAFSLVSSHALYQTHPFSEVSAGALLDSVETVHAAFVDYDADGDEDLYATANATPPGRVLRNDGGAFLETAVGEIEDGGGPMVWADYDADGDLDLFAGPTHLTGLYRNDGGAFASIPNGPYSGFFDNSPRSAAFADYDLDGDLDLYVVHAQDWNKLWRNDGAAGWIDATTGPLTTFFNWDSRTFWYDYDTDGDPDLFLGGGSVRFYRNDGGGAFANMGPHGGGWNNSAWGDYDNDGDLDVYNCGYNDGANSLRRNDGGVFVDVSAEAGMLDDDPVYTHSAVWADWNNDGWLDLFVVNDAFEQERLFLGRGNGTFRDVTIPAYLVAEDMRGSAVSDVDADGDVDLLLYGDGPDMLFRNDDAGANNWLLVAAVAGGATAKSDAAKSGSSVTGAPVTGAVVSVEVNGVTQTRWIGLGGNANTLSAHFGLGTSAVADRVEILWPGSNDPTVLLDVAANQAVVVDRDAVTTGVARSAESIPGVAALHQNVPNPFNPVTRIRYEVSARGPVALRVFDIAGRLVRTIVADGMHEPGAFDVLWDGRLDSGGPAASGAYFYRLETPRAIETRKMILVK